MKYLKKFNEELKSGTYKSASNKLKKLGHVDRANELESFAKTRKYKENLIKWSEVVKKYSKYGTFKMNIDIDPANGLICKSPFSDDFYLAIIFEDDQFSDCFDEIGKNYLSFFVGIIPKNEEIIKKIHDIDPDVFFDNGFYFAFEFFIIFNIDDDNNLTMNEHGINNIEESINISIADRQSAGKFKSLLKRIFNDHDFDYPSANTQTTTIWKLLEKTLMFDNNLSDVNCGEYGFELHDIGDFINKISPNILYKTI